MSAERSVGRLGPDDEQLTVMPDRWHAEVAQLIAQGLTGFDSLHAIDEILRPDPAFGQGEQVRVVLRLIDHEAGRAVQLQTRVVRPSGVGGEQPGGELDSIADLFAGASWHEREAHDLFGVRFAGNELAPLLWHRGPGAPAHPMLKDAVLPARVNTPWPGVKDPEADGWGQASRRRTLPVGVPDPDAAPPEGDYDPAEIAAAVSGARVRRRR